jgi:membrane protein YdbS with pleckstrin-like domain
MADTVQLPSGEEIPDRRGGERREGPRRREDREQRRTTIIVALVWALMGSVVVLYLFFVALDAVNPADAPAASIAVAVLALLWLAHAWRRLYMGGYSSRDDRERRGF